MLYYQINRTISRQYKYLGKLETELSNILTPFKFEREGRFYKFHISWYERITKVIYAYLFPVFILFTVIVSGIINFRANNVLNLLTVFNFLIYGLIAIITLLYFIKRK